MALNGLLQQLDTVGIQVEKKFLCSLFFSTEKMEFEWKSKLLQPTVLKQSIIFFLFFQLTLSQTTWSQVIKC